MMRGMKIIAALALLAFGAWGLWPSVAPPGGSAGVQTGAGDVEARVARGGESSRLPGNKPGAGDVEAPAGESSRLPGMESCAERVVLTGGGGIAFGSITRSALGPVSVRHVFEKDREILVGPKLAVGIRLDATDFAFLGETDAQTPPEQVTPMRAGRRVVMEGFPARAHTIEIVAGEVYAPDTVPPGWWILIDHIEPLVGGFSGGCVRDAETGEPIAVMMGASSMKVDGETRHFARVVPIHDALREAQGHDWTGAAPSGLAALPVPHFNAAVPFEVR